jgi:hypothetical protein
MCHAYEAPVGVARYTRGPKGRMEDL